MGDIPAHAMLDVWMALGGEPAAFYRMWDEDRRTPADTWAQLMAAVGQRLGSLAADTNPPIGPEFDCLIFPAVARRHPPETTMSDHAPDSPFGCGATWGVSLGRPDTYLHVCNLPERHQAPCRCKCGVNAPPPPIQTLDNPAVAGSAAPTGDDDGD